MKSRHTLLIILFCAFLMNPSFTKAQHSEDAVHTILSDFDSGLIDKQQAISQVKKWMHKPGHILKCGTEVITKLGEDVFKGVSQSSDDNNDSFFSTYLSSSGRFSFDYATTGTHAVPDLDINQNGVPDYVERAALEMEKVYAYQVQELGYKDPLERGSPYSINFRFIGEGVYGYTSFDGRTITIHSTFENFENFAPNNDPEGVVIGALKVTLAHEFKHAIQYMYNSFSGNSHTNWREMDATLMEEDMYDEVNDYYNYLPGTGSLFTSPSSSLSRGWYEDITFALYFQDKFGKFFWPNVWSRIPDETSIFTTAISRELNARGSSIEEEYLELVKWHFFSGSRAVTGYGFEEALNYPNVRVEQGIQSSITHYSSSSSIGPLAYRVFPIVSDGSSTFINLGIEFNGRQSPIPVVTNSNPRFGEIAGSDIIKSRLLKTNSVWSDVDTLFYIVPNGSVGGSSAQSRLIIMNDNNPGIWFWGDANGSSNGEIDIDINDTRLVMRQALGDINTYNPSSYIFSDITQDGTISGLDASYIHAYANGTFPTFILDADENLKTPEVDFFRTDFNIEKEIAADSLILSFKPLDVVDEAARLELFLDYHKSPWARSIQLSLPIDTLNLELLSIEKDLFLSSSEIDYTIRDDSIHVLLVNDAPIPSGPLLIFRYQRKTNINRATFSFGKVKVDEYDSIDSRLVALDTEIPTRIQVSNEEMDASIPSDISISEVYPNPFNPTTSININLPHSSNISIQVYNSLGQLVQTSSRQPFNHGRHTIELDGSAWSSGLYFVIIRTPNQVFTRKALLLK